MNGNSTTTATVTHLCPGESTLRFFVERTASRCMPMAGTNGPHRRTRVSSMTSMIGVSSFVSSRIEWNKMRAMLCMGILALDRTFAYV